MAPPIIFSRTTSLGAPGASLSLSSIPGTGTHLLFHVAARLDSDATDDLSLDLTINGSVVAQYDGNTSKGNTTTIGTGVGNDGLNQAAWRLADLTTSDATAGLFTEVLGIIPRYAVAEYHTAMWIAHSIDGATVGDLWRHVGMGINDAVSAAITSLDIAAETAANLAAGSAITVWGLAEEGDATPVARSAGSLTLDFTSDDELLDVTLTGGINNTFVLTNPYLGRTLTIFMAAAGGGTQITLPATVEVLKDSYDPTKDAILILRCVDESTPGYVATLSAVEANGGTF